MTDSTIITLAVTDGGDTTTTIHPTLADAEACLRANYDTDPADYAHLDLEELIESLEDRDRLIIAIEAHPLRSVATDTSGIDQNLLAEQIATVDRILSRCADDTPSSTVTITDHEAEHLEGVWNLLTGLLTNP